MGFLLPVPIPENCGSSKTLKRRRSCSITSSQWSTTENPESAARRALLAGLATFPFVTPAGAEAFCGDEEPFWAHYVDWQEGLAPIAGREVYLRVLGNQKKEKRAGVSPLIVLADAGLPWNYLETISALAVRSSTTVRLRQISAEQELTNSLLFTGGQTQDRILRRAWVRKLSPTSA
mmetsp:Transcript_9213/g.40289  ORF Transcript_9213/g.40289 Transcript_9213/m.40289 type:complete len:177 (-) Transcript_9213:610-1140(-)